MNTLVTKERRIREVKQSKAHERFHRALEAAAAGEPIDIRPADNADDHILRVLIVDDHRATADTLSLLVAKWGHDVGVPTTALRVWRWPLHISRTCCCSTC